MSSHLLLDKIPGSEPHQVAVPSFEIKSGEHWAVIGDNGSGKSTFAAMLSGKIQLDPSQRVTPFEKVLAISFEDEQRLLEREIYEDDSEWINKIDQGRTTYELITEHLQQGVDLQSIIDTLQLQNFLHTGFRILSTGERRRLMIARALSQAPQMLILDEPYDGLDHAFVSHLKEVIAELSQQIPLVIIVNRMSHLGDFISHIACLHDMKLVLTGTRSKIESSELWNQLQTTKYSSRDLPAASSESDRNDYDPREPLIKMCSVNVGYQNKQIIRDLDWKIMPGEHWKISGPNGSGKSTLMNLISGDHTQCFSNEIYVFGQQRGCGESIWDIKRNLGLMSTALHQQYRAHVTCLEVILSGFFDSIGVYTTVTSEHRKIAEEWLSFIGLKKYARTVFKTLSFGQQRILLIARALIKRPRLLLLDEPCQGLDPINRALTIQLITQIAELKIAHIIYISHDAEDHLSCLTHELVFTPSDSDHASIPGFKIKQLSL